MRHRRSCRSGARRVLRELSPIERALAEHLPHLRGPQRRGLALWVLGAVLAQSACQAAVLVALLPWAPYHALRQRLREWLLDGADKAAPCATQGEAEACFAPPPRWVLGWWPGGAGPAGRGLGRPRSARPAEGPGPDGHLGRGLDGGAGGALGRGHRPAARPRRGELVCAAGLGRARLPGPQGCRLAVAALAPDR